MTLLIEEESEPRVDVDDIKSHQHPHRYFSQKKMKFLLLCLFMAIVSVLAQDKRHSCCEYARSKAEPVQLADACVNACSGNVDMMECLCSVEVFKDSFGDWKWRWLTKSAENTKPPVAGGGGDGFTCTKLKEPMTVSHCADGWKGDRCDEPVPVSHCADGWKGDRCDQKVVTWSIATFNRDLGPFLRLLLHNDVEADAVFRMNKSVDQKNRLCDEYNHWKGLCTKPENLAEDPLCLEVMLAARFFGNRCK